MYFYLKEEVQENTAEAEFLDQRNLNYFSRFGYATITDIIILFII